jgi:signal peptidase I
MKKKNNFKGNIKSIFFAILIALIIRSFIVEPFNIPSGSMKPNLLVGDFIFVSKWSYGYSRHSLPFSINIIPKKIFSKMPDRGDVVVFKTPQDNRTDYIKRVIGIPGDKIRMINGHIEINGNLIFKKITEPFIDTDKNQMQRKRKYVEFFYNKEIEVLDLRDDGPNTTDNTIYFIVPKDNLFVMGDNRDNSSDSRIIGFVPIKNLVGKAQFIFFSLENSRFFQIWKWPQAIRFNRLFQFIT